MFYFPRYLIFLPESLHGWSSWSHHGNTWRGKNIHLSWLFFSKISVFVTASIIILFKFLFCAFPLAWILEWTHHKRINFHFIKRISKFLVPFQNQVFEIRVQYLYGLAVFGLMFLPPQIWKMWESYWRPWWLKDVNTKYENFKNSSNYPLTFFLPVSSWSKVAPKYSTKSYWRKETLAVSLNVKYKSEIWHWCSSEMNGSVHHRSTFRVPTSVFRLHIKVINFLKMLP